MEKNLDILVMELCKLPKEVGWVEFKHNNCEPNMIGEDISALANTATLKDRDNAYMIWGVDDNWRTGFALCSQRMPISNS